MTPEKIYPLGNTAEIFHKCAEMYCGKFDIDSENQHVIENVILWLARDEKFNRSEPGKLYHLNKGLLLIGNPGSGKTTLLEICQILLRKTYLQFQKYSAKKLVDEFAKRGVECLKEMNGNLFIDDFGIEKNAVHFADRRELLQDIIGEKYDQYRYTGDMIHLTSMSSLAEIEERYGEYVLSRLKQMCNIFILGGSADSIDRRDFSIGTNQMKEHQYPRLYATQREYDDYIANRKMLKIYEQIKQNAIDNPVEHKGLGARMREQMDEALGMIPKGNESE